MKAISLNKQGAVTLVDDVDYESLSLHKWHLSSHGRAVRSIGGRRTKGTTIYLHRQLLGFPECDVDHINGDPLGNRRTNLRDASRTQNQLNAHRFRPNKNGFKGVRWKKRRGGGSFAGCFRINGKRYEKAGFKTAEEAARHYDLLARRYGGEFAQLNFDAARNPAREPKR